jgi:hypothetical protein
VAPQTRLTDDKGRFYFGDLPPGDFAIDAMKFDTSTARTASAARPEAACRSR